MKTKRIDQNKVRSKAETFMVTQAESEWIQRKADEKGVTKSGFLRMVIADMIKKEEKK